jgi:chitin disaccharide deacetylase
MANRSEEVTVERNDGGAARMAASVPREDVRRILLCADDYGISPGVSEAIRELLVRGRLNATSAMVVAPSLSRAEALSLSILNVGSRRGAIGLHLTLSAPFRPLSAAFRPRRHGTFLPLAELVLAALLRRLDAAAIAAEVDAQLEHFATLFGAPPDFVDGHHHVHLLPQVRGAVLATVKRAAPGAYVRQCGSARPLWRSIHDPKGLFVAVLSRALCQRAQALGVPTNPAFAGTYAFRPDADFPALFPRFLDGLPDGGLIMCHPGHVDAELERLDPLTDLREKEFAYLASDAFADLLAARKVALTLSLQSGCNIRKPHINTPADNQTGG